MESTSRSGVQGSSSLAEGFPSSLPVCLCWPSMSSSANTTSLSHSPCSLPMLGSMVPRAWMNIGQGQKMSVCADHYGSERQGENV